MSKKDYIAVAKAFRSRHDVIMMNCNQVSQDALLRLYTSMVGDVAHAFEADNDRFDYDKFITACGVNNG